MGWGWTKTINTMSNNRILANKVNHYAKHMYDVAGIYTLSAQPGSVISNNYIDSIYKAPYAHDPDHWFYLYTDEGSSYFRVKDNCALQKSFFKMQITRVTFGKIMDQRWLTVLRIWPV